MRRILLIVFALVVLPSSAFARSGFLCRLDGAVRSSCCCPAEAQEPAAPRPAALHRQDCCTTVEGVPAQTQPTTQHSAAASLVQLWTLVADLAAWTPPPRPVVSRVQLAHAPAPPARDRDLFVRHCAFLL